MGGAIIVFLAFVLFEILISPLVVVDATSDPLEIASEKVFTITAQGPIVGLPTYLSRIVHWLVSYRVEGTSLQWLDFDKKSKNTVKVRSIGNGKLQLQDVYVPFDCAACNQDFPIVCRARRIYISGCVGACHLGGCSDVREWLWTCPCRFCLHDML